jgi:hypothetical protein
LHRERFSSNPASHVRYALWLYTVLVLLITAASWAVYAHKGTSETRPLFTKEDQFRDLTNYIGKTAHLHHGAAALGSGFPVFNYPPPAAFVYKALLYSSPNHPVRPYLVFLAICIFSFAAIAWRASQPKRTVKLATAAAILTTALVGYPLWFVADRGNIEGVVWALAAAGLCFALRGRYYTGAILIGLAAAIKPFPILFLLLLLRGRRYKEMTLGFIAASVVMLVALAILGPNPLKAYRDMKPGASYYMERYIVNLPPLEEARFEHSLLDGMKSAALTFKMGGIHPYKAASEIPELMNRPGGWRAVRLLVRVYPLVATIGLGLLLATFYKAPILNQLTALGVAATLFPLSSADYTLLHLYVPFGVFLVFLVREVAVGKVAFPYTSMMALAVIYALLFAPLTPLMVYAGDAKLLLLLALLFVTARAPMHSEYFSFLAEDRPLHPR